MNDSTRVHEIRARFPALGLRTTAGEPVVFFDGPGGTQVPQSVVDAMSHYLLTYNSNIEGEYSLTRETDEMIASAREYAGAFVGGDGDYIAFGQNTTTLNFNLATAMARTLAPGDEILVTRLDHDANVAPWLLVAKDHGLVVKTVGLTQDLLIDLDDLKSQLSPRTKVVAFSLASNAVGTLSPARHIADLAHEVGALAWVDAVAYAAHHRISVAELGCDVLLSSPYKYFGPHLGLAWIRPGLAESLPGNRVRPAGETPPGHRFETGTLSHEALAGFIAAVEYIASLGEHTTLEGRLDAAFSWIERHEHELTEQFLSGISEFPQLELVGPAVADQTLRSGTFGLRVVGGGSARLARALGDAGIFTWNGSFYAQGVMEHLGLDLEEGLLRIGLTHYNTSEEVTRFFATLTRVLADAD